jgi:hypothetical protein
MNLPTDKTKLDHLVAAVLLKLGDATEAQEVVDELGAMGYDVSEFSKHACGHCLARLRRGHPAIADRYRGTSNVWSLTRIGRARAERWAERIEV